MNIPQGIVIQAKQVLQSQWSDIANILRNKTINNVLEDVTVYENVRCHFSCSSSSVQNQSDTKADTSMVYTLYVDTDIDIKQGDIITITHKNQVFDGVIGAVINGTFSNSAKVEVNKIA